MVYASVAGSPSTPDFRQATSWDDQLDLRIRRALTGTGCGPLQRVNVFVEDGSVALSGQVPTYYLKQLAQTVVMNVDGVDSLSNALTVC